MVAETTNVSGARGKRRIGIVDPTPASSQVWLFYWVTLGMMAAMGVMRFNVKLEGIRHL